MFRSTLVVSVLTAIASVVSFFNQLVIAHFFGAGIQLDVYFMAISLPLTVTAFLVGALGYQLVPSMQLRATKDGDCRGLVNSLLAGLGGGAIGLALILAILAPVQLAVLHPGLDDENRAAALLMMRIAWFWLPAGMVSAIYMAALHIERRFLLVAIVQSGPTLGALVFCVIASKPLGTSSLVWGQFVGSLATVLALRLAFGSSTGRAPDWQGLGRLLIQLPASIAALAIFVIYPLSDAFWGARLGETAVSYLGYAQRLVVGVSSAVVVGATVVLFPHLAMLAARGEHFEMRRYLGSAVRAIIAATIPAAMILSVVADHVLNIILRRGAFGDDDVAALAEVLPWMLVGMVPMAAAGLLFKAMFSIGDIRAAAGISVGGASVYFVLSGVLSEQFGLIGIGLAYTCAWAIVLIVALAQIWGRAVLSHIGEGVRYATRAAATALITAVAALIGAKWCSEVSTTSRELLALCGATLLAALVYVGLGYTTIGVPETRALVDRMVRLVMNQIKAICSR